MKVLPDSATSTLKLDMNKNTPVPPRNARSTPESTPLKTSKGKTTATQPVVKKSAASSTKPTKNTKPADKKAAPSTQKIPTPVPPNAARPRNVSREPSVDTLARRNTRLQDVGGAKDLARAAELAGSTPRLRASDIDGGEDALLGSLGYEVQPEPGSARPVSRAGQRSSGAPRAAAASSDDSLEDDLDLDGIDDDLDFDDDGGSDLDIDPEDSTAPDFDETEEQLLETKGATVRPLSAERGGTRQVGVTTSVQTRGGSPQVRAAAQTVRETPVDKKELRAQRLADTAPEATQPRLILNQPEASKPAAMSANPIQATPEKRSGMHPIKLLNVKVESGKADSMKRLNAGSITFHSLLQGTFKSMIGYVQSCNHDFIPSTGINLMNDFAQSELSNLGFKAFKAWATKEDLTAQSKPTNQEIPANAMLDFRNQDQINKSNPAILGWSMQIIGDHNLFMMQFAPREVFGCMSYTFVAFTKKDKNTPFLDLTWKDINPIYIVVVPWFLLDHSLSDLLL